MPHYSFLLTVYQTVIDSNTLPLWSRTTFKFNFHVSINSLNFSGPSPGHEQFYSQQGCLPSTLFTPWVRQKALIAFCNSNNFDSLLHKYCSTYAGPRPCLGHQSGSQSKDGRHPQDYCTLLWWKKSPPHQHNTNYSHFSHNFTESLLRFSKETTMKYLGHLYHPFHSKACQIATQSCSTPKAVKSVQIGTHLKSLKVEPINNFNCHNHAQCPKISKDLLL